MNQCEFTFIISCVKDCYMLKIAIFFNVFCHILFLYIKYCIQDTLSSRALGLAFRPSARESNGILYTTFNTALIISSLAGFDWHIHIESYQYFNLIRF